ncbi:hypothetical protein [Streptomyces sp. NPDC050988]|uniref:hypothetical protein n=1 Tax=Streptomyces sp. NPDC050988 TaxID=3365637 RepID=UPI0037B05444
MTGRATVHIPAPDEGAVKPWRKWLQRLDESQFGARACVGDWLEAGASYELPVGAMVVLCDSHPGGARKGVRIWRGKRDGTIKEERDSTLGSANAFGTSVRGTMRRLLEKHPARPETARQIAAAPRRVNEREDSCELCRPVCAPCLAHGGRTNCLAAEEIRSCRSSPALRPIRRPARPGRRARL